MKISLLLAFITFPIWFIAFIIKSTFLLVKINAVFIYNTAIMLYKMPDYVVYSFDIALSESRNTGKDGGQ